MEYKRFKNSFAENVFHFKYAQGPSDSWDGLAERSVEDVCGSRWGTDRPLMSSEDQKQLCEYIKTQKFIPGGRYLYYAGRPYKAFNNCFAAGTKVLSKEGWRFVEDLGKTQILSPVTGEFLDAEFIAHGVQPVQQITFAPVKGNSKITYKVKATRTHRWLLSSGHDTYDIRVGDIVPANTVDAGFDILGFAHGFVFGDGNANGQLRLCASKDKAWLNVLSEIGTVTYPPSANGDPVLYFKNNVDWKNLPTKQAPKYISSFIWGWLAADGSETSGSKLCSVNKEAMQWFREHAAFAGITITGELRSQKRNITLGEYTYKDHNIYIQTWSRGINCPGFKVIDISYLGDEPVYCPFEPKYNQIVIDHNIRTYQCYLHKGLEDTREEWSRLAHNAMACLTTGGGIGIDYSVFREAGKALSRTGGKSSGPIPLMYAINEIGRNVMQGGSRRSALYASLNWQHADTPDFLRAKNWHDMPIGRAVKADGTPYTHWDAKQEDFNHPAPLDMTNISLNYDNAWLNKEHRESDPIFLENCRQAMSTGEPGFSFNFGTKENETLRNAPVSGYTRVLLDYGYDYVKDIVGQEVTIWTGKQWANTTFKKTGTDVETIEVFMSNGRSIVCDPTHPFILWTKKGTSRVEAKDLKRGDSLFTSLPDKEVDDEDLYYGYGFVFGDGSIRDYRGEISIWDESKRSCFEKARKQLDAHVVSVPNRAYFKSSMVRKVFIPRRSFVAGWFDADGSYSRGLLRLSCKDKGLLLELSEYLDDFGIKSLVREDGTSNYKPVNKMYTLQVLKSSFAQFKKHIPTLRLNIDVPSTVRTQNVLVQKVVPTGVKEDVYCCDVGVEEHSFQAEGVIISNCTEVTSEDDSDVCNLGSVNMGNIQSLDEFTAVVGLAAKFLVCGTLRADLPYDKVYKVREKNRRLGLGLMGIHEWLLQRGMKYEVTSELKKWLAVYRDESERAAKEHCDRLFISHPVAFRAIAPTGTIGILAATTTGIEPLFAVAYKRRFLTDGTKWKYQYVVDGVADRLIRDYDLKPETIDTAYKLSHDYERRIRFQADVQDYVDMSISSTINLPSWGSRGNREENVADFARVLSKFAPRLRGFTCYPDGARGGQPITEVDYKEALEHKDVIYEELDVCSITGKGGVCGS